MAPIFIDFAPCSLQRSWHRVSLLTRIAAFLGLLLCLGAGVAVSDLFEQRRVQAADLAQLQTQLALIAAPRPSIQMTTISETQAAAVNRAIAQLNLPWPEVFNAVEAATPATVALLALEPDASRQLLRILAETKTSDEIFDYVEQLKKQAFFRAVILTKHEIHEQDPNKPWRFELEAQWGAGTP